MAINLYPYQIDSVKRMTNGCILNGGVGSGKSRTSLAYYYVQNGGPIECLTGDTYIPMKNPRDLYVITTSRKRDTKEWLGDMAPFLLSDKPEANYYKNTIVIDSWNNIKKYSKVNGAFFIFDEQRVVGSGAWVKAFLNIARKNQWILLSATPGDQWSDYIPVFIANGFYHSKTEFLNRHAVYSRFTKYPKIDRYIDTGILMYYRNKILINMDFKRDVVRHDEDIFVRYSIDTYKDIFKNRWDPFENKPIETAANLCYLLRKVVNSDESRQVALLELLEKHDKAIIFYNFNYELDILRSICKASGRTVAEWNGNLHEHLPTTKNWVYLVQYQAGCEGWNCITTDTVIFYSQTYSYRVLEQAKGRIDRLNTPYKDLYYYHLKTQSGIDLAITRALKSKKKFNEAKWVNW